MNRPIKVLIAGALASLALFGVSTAGPLEDGEAAYRRGDYATAIGFLRPLAEHGEAEAQSDICPMYDLGQGVPKDYAQAAIWRRKAADHGYTRAQAHLGLMYRVGNGVPKDFARAHVV
jgi:TPR repeat protein